MKLFFVIFQTILNFIALNVLFQNIANKIVPNSPLGAFIGILHWVILLLLSYGIAVRFKNKE